MDRAGFHKRCAIVRLVLIEELAFNTLISLLDSFTVREIRLKYNEIRDFRL
jgi:hypothetical protein